MSLFVTVFLAVSLALYVFFKPQEVGDFMSDFIGNILKVLGWLISAPFKFLGKIVSLIKSWNIKWKAYTEEHPSAESLAFAGFFIFCMIIYAVLVS